MIPGITGNTLRSDSESLLQMTQKRSMGIVSLSVRLSLLSLFALVTFEKSFVWHPDCAFVGCSSKRKCLLWLQVGMLQKGW